MFVFVFNNRVRTFYVFFICNNVLKWSCYFTRNANECCTRAEKNCFDLLLPK